MSVGEWCLVAALVFVVWLTVDLVALFYLAAAVALPVGLVLGVQYLLGMWFA